MAVAGILYGASGGVAYAQQAPAAAAAPAEAQVSDSLEEVVVTANAANGVKKLDASYNIVSVDAELIKEANPKSTADLLKVSPGLWPESSGGQTGANIEVAGFPSGGDAPFFTNMIEGTPLYGMPSLSFMDSSSLFRLDDTVQKVEIVQGGPSAIYGPAQMGAQANFILKRGTQDPSGSISGTWGSEGLLRADVFFGFPVMAGWVGSVGGFYRESDGVRDPQFPADKGGQITATLSKDLDGGSILFWARALDDKNQFIVPIPVIETGLGTFSQYPGFNALSSSYGSKAIQNVTLPNPAGGFEQADLANGRGGNLYYLGSKFEDKFGDWSVLNNFLFDGGYLPTNALFSGPNPRPLSYYLYGCNVAQPTGYCNGATAVDTNNLNGGQGYNPAVYNINAVYAGSGAPVGANTSVITQGWWFIQKRLQNVNDEFRLSRELFEGNTATAGIYIARYSMDDNWSLGNTMLMSNTPNAQPIDLSYTLGGTNYYLTSPQGFVNFNGNYNILEHGDATNEAFFLSDSWKIIDPLLVDVGGRIEHIDAKQRTCNTTPMQLGTAQDLWDNATPECNGTWTYLDYSRTAGTWTVGVNYELASNMSVYFRANNGVHYDDFDNGIRGSGGNFAPIETVKNYEGGYKFQNPLVYVDVSAYKRDFTGLQYQETNGAGIGSGAISTYGASTWGIDLITTVTPFTNFSVRLVGDYMVGHYDDYIGCAPYRDILGNPLCAQFNGSPLQRQPKLRIDLTPSYTIPDPWGSVTAFITWEHSGQRYEDQTGLQPLGTYDMLNMGVLAEVGKNWEFRLAGTNLTNTVALTEGNARVNGAAGGIGGVLLGRPIEGAEVNITAKYKF